MKVDEQIALLAKQVKKIAKLSKTEDHDAYREWHKQTELLLKAIFQLNSDEVREFRQLNGESAVVTMSDDEENSRRKTEAYFRHLKASKGLLNGVLGHLVSTVSSHEALTIPANSGNIDAFHKTIAAKCSDLYLSENYAEAVEKGFKVVRDRLRELSRYETGSEAFGKGALYINGASAINVDKDFQEGVKFLTMAIDKFRNEKSHTSDGKIANPIRAYEYLAMSSLAMHLLDDAFVRESPGQEHEKSKINHPNRKVESEAEQLDSLQILALRAFACMEGYKELLITYPSGGGGLVHPLGNIADKKTLAELNEVNAQELEASLDELQVMGVLTVRHGSSGESIYKPTKSGYKRFETIPESKTI